MKVSSCYATPSQRILYFSRNSAQGHTTELWGRLLYFSKELTSNKAEQIMKYVTLWISLLPAAKCPGAAHALFNVALQNCCTELYIGVCTWERGVSLLLSQLLGKVPVNIWVLRNISCDGSYQYFGILSGVGRCYQQVECVWASALPRRHTSWKNCFKKLTKNQNKSPLLEPVRFYMRHHYCKSCVGWWNPWTNLEMSALYWSQAGPGHLQHHSHERFEGSLPTAALDEVNYDFKFQSSLFPHKFLPSPWCTAFSNR